MAKRLEIGTHFWPWDTVKNLLAYGEQSLQAFPFDQIWMVDALQYEDCFTVLTAMAMKFKVALGTQVTFPWRNPLELTQRFASIAELMEGREISVGIGAGGRLQEQVLTPGTCPAPVAVVIETVKLLRGIFRGEAMPLGEFPELSSRFHYNPHTRAKLYFPPATPPPVYLAAGGPKMFEAAGEHCDGVILTQINPLTSLSGMRRGGLREAVAAIEQARQRVDPKRPFKKIYSLKISVSKNGDRARQWAKRQASYGIATYPSALKKLGIDPSQVEAIREAYVKGMGIEEAARRVSDELFDHLGFVVAGTPEECINGCQEILSHLEGMGFDHLVMGVPLGPDVPEALRLIGQTVLPALIR